MGKRTSIYLSDELAEAVRASGVPIAELVRRGLEASRPEGREEMRRAVAYLGRLTDRLAEGWQLVPPGRDEQATPPA